MSLKDFEDLNEMQLDALREIGNIGSGNAASALSLMLSRSVDIAVPKIKILDYQTVVDYMGGAEKIMVGILVSLDGDVNGMMMFLHHKEYAHMLINELTGSNVDENWEDDDFSRSAIQEVGNIMAASYINAMAELTGLSIGLSVPSLCIDMTGSILSVPAIYYGDLSDQIIFIEDEFNHNTESAASHILLIPEVESLQRIMTSLGLDE